MKSKSSFSFIALYLLGLSFIYLHTTDSLDQDLGRHLKLGEIIWQTKQLPKVNLFSYTHPQEPVFNSHWGSQGVFYLIYISFGIKGLVLLSTVINTAAFFLLFILAARRNLAAASVLTLIFSPMLLDRTWIRPEMFGNLFYAILLASFFHKEIRKFVKWGAPLIFMIWGNLHISFLIGLFALCLLLLQDILEVTEKKKRLFIFINGTILFLTFLALAVNPYGLKHIYLASTVLNKYGYSIVENQSWFFLKGFGFPLVHHLALGFATLVVSFLLTKRKPLVGECALLAIISIATLRFVRHEVLFAYTAFLTSSLNLAEPRKKIVSSPLIVFSLLLTLAVINYSHKVSELPVGFGNKEKYKAGLDFFVAQGLDGPIFNNFDIGGYLIYRLYPEERVFVDNRPEAYPVDFFEKVYIPIQEDPSLFKATVEQYGIKTIVWGTHDRTPWGKKFLFFLEKDNQWKKRYQDNATLIYTLD